MDSDPQTDPQKCSNCCSLFVAEGKESVEDTIVREIIVDPNVIKGPVDFRTAFFMLPSSSPLNNKNRTAPTRGRGSNTVKIQYVLSTIYKLNNKNFEEEDITLCIRCSKALTVLYNAYVEFHELRHMDSTLQGIICPEKSRPRPVPKSNKLTDNNKNILSNNTFSLEQYQPKIKLSRLKIIDVNLVDNSPVFIEAPSNSIEMVNSDNDFSTDFDETQDDDFQIKEEEVEQDLSSESDSKEVDEDDDPLKLCEIVLPQKRAKRGIYAKFAPSQTSTTCPNCQAPFQTARKLIDHLLSVHSESRTVCPICQESKSDMRRHLKEHVEAKPHNCNLCQPQTTYRTRYDLEKHCKAHWNKTKKIECPYVNCPLAPSSTSSWSTTSKEKMKGHWLEFHRATHCCIICFKSQKSPKALENHYKEEHPGQIPFQCHICFKIMVSARTLKKHMSLHKTKPFQCPSCKERFPFDQKEFYENHLAECRGSKRANCTICGLSCSTYLNLYEHLKSHEGTLPCSYCDLAFPNQQKLDRHFTVRHGAGIKKSHICQLCQKRFHTPCKLKAHLRSHTKEKPFVCDVCGKSFGLANTLNQHLLIHTKSEDRPFKCSYDGCTKAFNRAELVQYHVSHVHHGIKEHLCFSCGKSFAQKLSLRKHMEQQHPENE